MTKKFRSCVSAFKSVDTTVIFVIGNQISQNNFQGKSTAEQKILVAADTRSTEKIIIAPSYSKCRIAALFDITLLRNALELEAHSNAIEIR